MSDKEQLQEMIDIIESLDKKYDHLLYAFPRGKLRILVRTIKEQQQEIDRLNKLCSDKEKSLHEAIAIGENLEKQLDQVQRENEKLRDQLSLLCPIADLPVIDSLLAEKQMYMVQIKELEEENKRLKKELKGRVKLVHTKSDPLPPDNEDFEYVDFEELE
jgi:chromosome segregation ATPase